MDSICIHCTNCYQGGKGWQMFLCKIVFDVDAHEARTKEFVFNFVQGDLTEKIEDIHAIHDMLCTTRNKNGDCKDFKRIQKRP